MAVCGTRSAYVGGCRCDLCRQAHNVAQTRWRQTGSAARPAGPEIRQLAERRWVRRAACAGHGFADWFVDDPSGKYLAARAVCDRCVVKRECLTWAIEAKIHHGMWGGLNPAERERAVRTTRAS